MASIVSARIMGIRQAQNTIGDINYNSTYYSVLVYYSDGTTRIAEGYAHDIDYLMEYVPREDSAERLEQILADHEQKIKAMLDNEILKVFNVIKPVPAVKGMKEKDALQLLQKAGFTVITTYNYSPAFSDNVVADCYRTPESGMDVNLTVNAYVPDVYGRTEQEAEGILEAAGFKPVFSYTLSEKYPYGTVIEASVQSDKTVNVCMSDGANKVSARSVDIRANTLPDSDYDEYEASAWVERKAHMLYVRMELVSSCRKTHTITGYATATTSFAKNERVSVSSKPDYEITGKEPVRIKLAIPVTDNNWKLADIRAAIETTHGLMKSKFNIELNIHIDW